MRKSITVIFVALAILLTGCQSGVSNKYRTSDVEEAIMQGSKEVLNSFEVKQDVELVVKKEGNQIISYPVGSEDKQCRMFIPENFYDEEEFITPNLSKEGETPKVIQKKLKIAQDIVCSYIDNSKYIKEEDKVSCKEAVQSVKIRYGIFENAELKDSPMLTSGSIIYVSEVFEEYISEYFFIHELIHVASNQTNKGSRYEKSSYRASKLNEAITDLIAIELSQRNGFSGYTISAYQDYYEFAFYVIANFDVMKAYYYSDEYEKITSDMFDLYTIVLDNLYTDESANEQRTVLYYILNEWQK